MQEMCVPDWTPTHLRGFDMKFAANCYLREEGGGRGGLAVPPFIGVISDH